MHRFKSSNIAKFVFNETCTHNNKERSDIRKRSKNFYFSFWHCLSRVKMLFVWKEATVIELDNLLGFTRISLLAQTRSIKNKDQIIWKRTHCFILNIFHVRQRENITLTVTLRNKNELYTTQIKKRYSRHCHQTSRKSNLLDSFAVFAET